MCANKTGSLEDLVIFGVDIGKDTLHLVGFDRADQLVMRKQIKRLALSATFEQLPRCIVGMEACLSAHFVSRTLRGMGFEPRIIPALYVKPFNKGQKNGYNDAEAIAEAALRPNLRTVWEKDQDQLDLQALHRVGARLVSRRTASINQIRAFLIEQGITVRSGLRALKNSFEAILEQRRGEIEQISRTEENCANVMTIPGIGPMISTAMVAAVGKGEAFDRGRDFAAWVSLVPTQYSTGGRTINGRITKRGSRYLRMLFVQAAKIIMMRQNRWSTFSFGPWLTEAVKRMPRNKAAVALANKLARTAWSVLRHGTRFDAPRDMAMETI